MCSGATAWTMTDPRQPEVKFEGEEADAGFASPTLDLNAWIKMMMLHTRLTSENTSATSIRTIAICDLS